jgi:E3 ubiquitin-protein ligase HUWE1
LKRIPFLVNLLISMAEDIGILEHADLVHSDGEDAMNQWFGELTAGREAQFFPGPPIAGRRRSGEFAFPIYGIANICLANVAHDLNFFGGPRAVVSSGPEHSTHPLLVDPSGSQVGVHSHPRSSHRRTNRGNQAANAYTDLLQTIEDLVSGGALQLFQQLMSAGRGASELHIDLPAPLGAHLVPGLDRNAIHRHGRSAVFTTRMERPARTEPRVETQDFGPLPTLQRWGEEAKMIHGKFIGDRVSKLANHVTVALLPAAREAAREAKRKAKEQEEQEEQRRKEEEALKEKEASEAPKRASAEELDAPAQVPTPTEEHDEHAAEPGEEGVDASRAIEEDTTMEDASHSVGTSDAPTQIVENAVAATDAMAAESGSTALQDTPMVAPPSDADSENVAGPSTSLNAEEGREENAASGPSSTERVTVMIHGNAVDITDTGIDHTFLEALPDDMREEVLNQHFRERRSARQMQPPESQISPEFLDALPPELRAEILQQETNERTRFRAPAQPQVGTDPVGPVDIDPASFLASLDPQLRQVVLMDQEDGFLQTLPSHMIAEAGVWRERTHRRFGSPPHVAPVMSTAPDQSETPRKAAVSRDAIQLLDKNGLATLVRLLFFPQLPRKNVLLKIFVNLCENSKTRAELLNLLLDILQDGTGDLAAVDKSFAQLSFRSRSQPSQATPKTSTKSKPSVDVLASASSSWQLTGESVPNLVVQRCLEALTFVVSTNETASRFFLTEHEVPSGLKRTSSKKGKGKEKQLPQVHYPIVPLLALLDGQTLLRTPTMMDSLAALLATVTRQLSNLKDSNKKEEASKAISAGPSVDATAENTIPPPSTTDAELSSGDQPSTNINTDGGESNQQSPPILGVPAAVETVGGEAPSALLGESSPSLHTEQES